MPAAGYAYAQGYFTLLARSHRRIEVLTETFWNATQKSYNFNPNSCRRRYRIVFWST